MANPSMSNTADDGPWRAAVRITLAHRAGDAPDASAVAEAIISTWSQMSELLTPVIGARGVDVIFRRSLYLTAKVFPDLAPDEEQGERAALLANLKTCLAGQDADNATVAGYNLLTTFIDLLATLIGESLTELLLMPVWDSLSSSSEQEIDS